VGESTHKLLPPSHNVHEHDHRRFTRYLLPQPPDVHASDIFVKRGWVQAKDGTLLSGTASVQLFYNEGKISFGVASINSCTKEEMPLPSPVQTPPASPSTYFSFFDALDDSCSGHPHHPTDLRFTPLLGRS